MDSTLKQKLQGYYRKIYKDEKSINSLLDMVDELLAKYPAIPDDNTPLSEKEAVLITYGDTILPEQGKALNGLSAFLETYVHNAFSTVHLLPIYPYSSDDGYSIIDYKAINPTLGDWEDVEKLGEKYSLMTDAVINHISKQSEWFKGFLSWKEPYNRYFLVEDPNDDFSSVARPRVSPLLSAFDTADGKKWVWTTFSDDQIDLNFGNVEVYAAVLDVLLFYAQKKVKMIRFDAIGYVWKEKGSSCLNLPEVHWIVQSLRAILDEHAPGTRIITETNVPHLENISYFGGEYREAQLVYQFPLPPLVMYTILAGNCEKLSAWAAGLDQPKNGCTYFNFLSSHDGIGVRPVEGILDDSEIQVLLDNTLRNGGKVSYKTNSDGSRSPYELNINYQDALASPDDSDSLRRARFLAAETILLSMQGVPGIYIHSLLGSRNDYYDREVTGVPRQINREKLSYAKLQKQLDTDTNRSAIFNELIRRLQIRRSHSAFSPDAAQKIVSDNPSVFHFYRSSDTERIHVLVNISSESQSIDCAAAGQDLLSGEALEGRVLIVPYQSLWILEDGK